MPCSARRRKASPCITTPTWSSTSCAAVASTTSTGSRRAISATPSVHFNKARVRALAGTARVVATKRSRSGADRVGQARRRSAAGPALPGVPADRFRPPPRRPEPSVEPVRDQAQGPAGPTVCWYEGNWRDIFQNWEALAFSYPEFVENMIAKFVNASTVDGYNPYRITRDGIDWEVDDPEDPWSHIGYWGDHQIIYLLKFLELSRRFHPARLASSCTSRMFAYANVPYRIRRFARARRGPEANRRLRQRAGARRSTDASPTSAPTASWCSNADGEVYLVNLLREAAGAAAGQARQSRRRWRHLAQHAAPGVERRQQRAGRPGPVDGHALLHAPLRALPAGAARRGTGTGRTLRGGGRMAGATRPRRCANVRDVAGPRPDRPGPALAARCRSWAWRRAATGSRSTATGRFSGKVRRTARAGPRVARQTPSRRSTTASAATVARTALYHAYNLLDLARRSRRRPALLDAGGTGRRAQLRRDRSAEAAAALVESLFAQRPVSGRPALLHALSGPAAPGLPREEPHPRRGGRLRSRCCEHMLAAGDERIVVARRRRLLSIQCRTSRTSGDLEARLDALAGLYGDDVEASREPLRAAVTRRSSSTASSRAGRAPCSASKASAASTGTWSRSSCWRCRRITSRRSRQDAGADVCRRLGELYYRVRDGLGFNKTPAEYGAFPTDPYSHTPGHGGAQQPGHDRTGQGRGAVALWRTRPAGHRRRRSASSPRLLRAREFSSRASPVPLPRRRRPMAGADGAGRRGSRSPGARCRSFTDCAAQVRRRWQLRCRTAACRPCRSCRCRRH